MLLLLSAVAGAGAVRQHWLACRGSMLSGSVLRGFAYGPDFSDGCLQAMDDGFSFAWPEGKDPWRPEAAFGVAFALLLALAWFVVVWVNRWSSSTRLLAALPAVLTAVAGLVTLVGPGGDALNSAYSGLLMLISATAVAALGAIAVRERPDRKTLVQVALALLAAASLGFFPMMTDYAFMTSFSDANWDTPPGTGCPTVTVIVLCAVALLALTLVRSPQRTTRDQDLVEAAA